MKPTEFELAAKGALSAEFEKSPIISPVLKELIKSNSKDANEEFDKLLPPLYRYHSQIQWSSVAVGKTIASWLQGLSGKKFIDIGCGVGKLCIVLRILTDLKIFGIEQRPHLVQIANEMITANGLKDITIIEKNLLDLNWNDYDIFYLFNPFQEHVSLSPTAVIDNTVNFHRDHFIKYTKKVYAELENLSRDKIFITYHGYGGKLPPSWKLTFSQYIDGGFLSLWTKVN
ncbi:MAG: methyltransferase domain-containing protein [Bdellovibrio sp.]